MGVVVALPLAVFLAALWLGAAARATPARPEARIRVYYDEWLRRVVDLAAVEEVEAFRALARDADRERFIRAFWEARGSGLLARFRDNELAVEQLRVRSRDEERVLRLLGKPERVEVLPGCGGRGRDLTLWRYPRWVLELQTGGDPGASLELLFVPTSAFDPRTLRLWSGGSEREPSIGDEAVDGPAAGQRDLDRAAAAGCLAREDPRASLLRRALAGSVGFDRLVARFGWPPPDARWLTALAAGGGAPSSATVVPALTPAARLAGRLRDDVALGVAFPGAYAGSTVVELTLELDAALLRRQAEAVIVDRLTVLGDVYRGTGLADSFETVFHVVGPEPEGGEVALAVQRRLRPGRYRLRLRLAGPDDLALLREDVELEVPELPAGVGVAGASSGLPTLTRAEVVRFVTFPRVELLDPGDRLIGTRATLEAVTIGGPFSAVELRRDGELVARDELPPFAAEVELPEHRHLLAATAYDRSGRAVATDELEIERRVDRLALDLRLTPEDRARGVAVALLEVPVGRRLARFECFADRTSTRTLVAPPWECPLPASSSGRISWVRAVATLEDGESVEDLEIVSGDPEGVEVQLVELSLSVLDARGRPVAGLGPADLVVREDGVEQPIAALRPVADLPLDVAVLMDVSSSLGRRVRAAAASAQGFFESILRPGDRASLLAFHHDVRQLVPFTGDVDRLRHGAAGLRAGGSTRLYDSFFYTLYTFAGLETRDGRRALVVLSDGADVDSDLDFAQVLEEAVRSRVAVYPIALGAVDEPTRAELARLARETGGSDYAASGVGELAGIYRRIEEELRSQYLLVYRPRHPVGVRDLSRVEVEVLRSGAVARHVRGHRP
ncbi:MAG TPA: VWA domain-containing protein [Thermoanaerobaculia bacterium]|nr:VWA domain-containing protein [Thermoanaerobaculia bacterium]